MNCYRVFKLAYMVEMRAFCGGRARPFLELWLKSKVRGTGCDVRLYESGVYKYKYYVWLYKGRVGLDFLGYTFMWEEGRCYRRDFAKDNFREERDLWVCGYMKLLAKEVGYEKCIGSRSTLALSGLGNGG